MKNLSEYKKITKTTLKSFLKANSGNLYFMEESRFDGMVDCVTANDKAKFSKCEGSYDKDERNLGFREDGLWLVGSSRDYFTYYNENGYEGIHCYNSCGSWTIAIRTEEFVDETHVEDTEEDIKNDAIRANAATQDLDIVKRDLILYIFNTRLGNLQLYYCLTSNTYSLSRMGLEGKENLFKNVDRKEAFDYLVQVYKIETLPEVEQVEPVVEKEINIDAGYNPKTKKVERFEIKKIDGRYYSVKISHELKPGNFHWVKKDENSDWKICKIEEIHNQLWFRGFDGIGILLSLALRYKEEPIQMI